MAVHTKLKHLTLDELWLDALNPRLGRRNVEKELSQDAVLDLMKDWTLDELAISFLESGFWPQEAVLVVREEHDGKIRNVVVEGNRRIAALRFLEAARQGTVSSKRWKDIVSSATDEQFARLEQIPYILADSRTDIETYLGFRHVTGIKQWNPTEKAQYIAHLVDSGLSYREVMRRIGSKTPTVRQNYITYRLLLQMENSDEDISVEKVEDKFSVLYLALRNGAVREFLGIDGDAEPVNAKSPVPPSKVPALVSFARWLFGDEKHEPIVTDSRQVDRFAKVLSNSEALDYLHRTDSPSLETAYRKTGGEVDDVIVLVERARDNVQEALTAAHRYPSASELVASVVRFGQDAIQLIRIFPEVSGKLLAAGVP